MSPFGDFMRGATTYLAGTAALTHEFVNNNVAPMVIGTAARINELHHEKVLPALGHALNEVNKGLEIANTNAAPIIAGTVANVREKVTPALHHILGEVSKGLDGFGQQHLGPTLQLTSDALNEFGEKHLGPAISVSIATLNNFGEKQIIPDLNLTGATLKEVHEKQLGPVIATLSEFSREKLAPAMVEAGKWVQDHPGETVVIVGVGVIIVYPGLVTTPALWVLGFGSEGVGSGTVASLAHSAIGDVAAGSLFATLQSAGAGGSGLVVVDGIVSAGALAIGALKIIDATKGGQPPKTKL